MEIWKNIKDYPNYEISNLGNVKRLDKLKSNELVKSGYYRTTLFKNQIGKHFFIHRLVALAFIDNLENKPQVNHINGIKTDNRLKNLEWVTRSENMQHAHKNNLVNILKGEDDPKSKITNEQALKILRLKKESNGKRYFGLKKLCIELNINYGIGCEISKGNNWKHLHKFI
jgi:hypothetical protein